MVISALRITGRPDELVNAAACFGGGIQHYDLCGLLTGGFMSIGFTSGNFSDNKEKSEFVKKATRSYWQWWEERAPKHCFELRPKYSWDKENYKRMIQRVACKVEELIKPVIGNR